MPDFYIRLLQFSLYQKRQRACRYGVLRVFIGVCRSVGFSPKNGALRNNAGKIFLSLDGDNGLCYNPCKADFRQKKRKFCPKPQSCHGKAEAGTRRRGNRHGAAFLKASIHKNALIFCMETGILSARREKARRGNRLTDSAAIASRKAQIRPHDHAQNPLLPKQKQRGTRKEN